MNISNIYHYLSVFSQPSNFARTIFWVLRYCDKSSCSKTTRYSTNHSSKTGTLLYQNNQDLLIHQFNQIIKVSPKYSISHISSVFKDSAVIDIVADIGNDNSTDNSDSTPTVSISNDASDQETVNSVPLMAIFLALIASCNSGK